MQIVCPHCQTSYQVDASAVRPTGRSVRCARCRNVWFAANTAALSDIAASHRAEMAQFAVPAQVGEAQGWPEPNEHWPVQDPIVEPEALDAVAMDEGFVPDAPPIAQVAPTPSGGQPTRPEGAPGMDAAQVESPSLVPIEDTRGEDIETVAARRSMELSRKQRFGWPLSWLPTAVLGLLLVDICLIGLRNQVVRLAPQTAALYSAIGLPVNLRGLELADVTVEMQTNDGAPMLLVQGQIVSAARHTVEVPRLRFAVRDATGHELYSWTALPSRSILSPGESVAFKSRLAAPPPEAHEVLVRFFNRHDLAASVQ